jgi:aldose 1-epimerase
MGFAVTKQRRPVGGAREAELIALDDGAGGRASIWPGLGFNCFEWQVVRGGQTLQLLYADPGLFLETEPRPTRSGIPILFPFPNRIRDGRFAWGAKEYQLPLNDSTRQNAIHGFACRRAWRLVGEGADEKEAWVRGAFRAAVDDPNSLPLWPADHEIQVTYRLGQGCLRIEAEVRNPDAIALPFGLGYHPYFRLPFTANARADNCTISVPARSYWLTKDSLPTGQTEPVAGGRDLNTPRRF